MNDDDGLALRHLEKNMLFHLLMIEQPEDLDTVIFGFMAMMEPGDVE